MTNGEYIHKVVWPLLGSVLVLRGKDLCSGLSREQHPTHTLFPEPVEMTVLVLQAWVFGYTATKLSEHAFVLRKRVNSIGYQSQGYCRVESRLVLNVCVWHHIQSS